MQDSQLTPTADVEKIAREWAELLHRPHISEDGLRDGIVKALAQARASLVEAITPYLEHKSTCQKFRPWRTNRPTCDCGLDAALTGTEISRVKEGEESNQIKKEINDDAR